jgi:hypothetical protein
MRNDALRRSRPKSPALWENDRVGAGMQRWRREFPEIDCSGKAVVGRLLHLHEVFLTAVNRTLGKHRLKYPAFACSRRCASRARPIGCRPRPCWTR